MFMQQSLVQTQQRKLDGALFVHRKVSTCDTQQLHWQQLMQFHETYFAYYYVPHFDLSDNCPSFPICVFDFHFIRSLFYSKPRRFCCSATMQPTTQLAMGDQYSRRIFAQAAGKVRTKQNNCSASLAGMQSGLGQHAVELLSQSIWDRDLAPRWDLYIYNENGKNREKKLAKKV